MPKDDSASAAAQKAEAAKAEAAPVTDDGAEEREAASAQKIANLMLLGAIKVNDSGMFERALRRKADVNCDNGLPLQLAAQSENELFMRRLVTAGAVIPYAVAALKTEQAGIKRKEKRTYDRYGYRDRVTYKYESKEEELRWKEITATVKTLTAYEKSYVTDVAPVESIRLQYDMLREMQELKDEVLTAIHGRPLAKKKLPPPKGPKA